MDMSRTRKCLIAAILTAAIMVPLATPASAAATAPRAAATVVAPDDLDQTQVKITPAGWPPGAFYVSFWGWEAKTFAALAIASGAGAIASGCGFIKPTSPQTVAVKILCFALSAPALVLVSREVNRIISSTPSAENWCFQVGPISKVLLATVWRPVATLKVVGVEHCR